MTGTQHDPHRHSTAEQQPYLVVALIVRDAMGVLFVEVEPMLHQEVH